MNRGSQGGTPPEDVARDTGGFTLTPQSLFAIDYIAPPAAVSDWITTLYWFRCDEKVIRDIQPAAIGHLSIFPHGVGHMLFRDGRADPSHETNLLTPFSEAAPYMVDGPFHAIGAVLSPLGWAALTGLDAAEHGNRLVRAGDYLGEDVARLGHELCLSYRAQVKTGPECALALADYIGMHAKRVNPRHTELIRLTNQWVGSSFNPDVNDLMAQAAYSQRQVQRLVERYFGLTPRALVRKYRALRAAALLSLPMLSPEYEAELGAAFYDQSHMIREIQRFVGRTPARLNDTENLILTELLSFRNFREIPVFEDLQDS